MLNHYISARVVALSFLADPPAIIRIIIAINVYSIYREIVIVTVLNRPIVENGKVFNPRITQLCHARHID